MLKTRVKNFITVKSEEKPTKLQFKPVLKTALSFIFGFLMMNPFVTGTISPFSVSLIASLSGIQSVSAAVGTAIGSFVFFDATDTVKYLAVALFCCMLNEICRRYFDAELNKFTPYINSFLSMLVISGAIMFATGFNLETFVTIIYESMLCCVGTYVFLQGNALVFGEKDFARFTTREYMITLLSAGVLLMPFYKYTVLNFSVIGVIFSFVILLLGRLKSGNGGTLAGVCVGICVGLSGQVTFLGAGYALAGLLCGELSRKSKYLSAVGFIGCVSVCAMIDSTLKAYLAIAEAAVACAVFLLLPDRFYSELSEKMNLPAPVYIKSDNSRVLTKRLSDASEAITELSDCVDTVQRTFAPQHEKELKLAIKSAWDKVCENCDLKKSCREEIRCPSDETIEKITQALSSHAQLCEIHFPKNFSESCYCFDEMKEKINLRYLCYTASLGAQGKVDQMQGLMSDQFKSMADILRDIACDFDEDHSFNAEITEICSTEARESGLNTIGCESYLDKFGRVNISLNISRPRENFNVTRFTEALSMATGTTLDLPEIDDRGDECTLKFSQEMIFCVDVGAFSRSTDDIKVCGDYYRSFRDANGRHITVLSDGMGTGSRAAVDSAMAAELFSKLIKSGLSFDCALPIANSALLVKSSDESLATLDVICVDLYTGKTDFMKAGAAVTYIRHRDSVAALEQASLPIGILREISFSKATAKLDSGDIILMVSDGILGDCNGWIQQELKLWDMSKSPRELAEYIVNSACERKLGKHRDDMTAVAIYIKENI